MFSSQAAFVQLSLKHCIGYFHDDKQRQNSPSDSIQKQGHKEKQSSQSRTFARMNIRMK
uniref:Uncharacterized protein n=1 Tax=Anguilla anguilla TaxID=7936 RepID=A0A0E9UM75_ANGAN